MKAAFALALPLALLAASPVAAAPRIEVRITAASVALAAEGATPAAVMARLAEAAGFALEGSESLPTDPISIEIQGSLEQVIAGLAGAANRLATYSAEEPPRLTRLLLLPTGLAMRSLPIGTATPADGLADDDPAVGGSRMSAEALREQIRARLGLSLR